MDSLEQNEKLRPAPGIAISLWGLQPTSVFLGEVCRTQGSLSPMSGLSYQRPLLGPEKGAEGRGSRGRL